MNRNFPFLFLTLILGVSSAWAAPGNTPYLINFSGYLTNSSGIPLTGSEQMLFEITLNGTITWCAQYSSVTVTNGDFSVVLGSSTQSGQGLDYSTCSVLTPANLPISPAIFTAVDSSVSVQVVVKIYDGSAWESFGSGFTVASSAFALQADNALVAQSATAIQGTLVSTTAPTANQVLEYVGGAWTPTTAPATTPAGATGQVQFNSLSSFGANNNFFWDNTNSRLGIGTSVPASQLDISGTNASGTLRVYDQTASGNTLAIIRAGAGQTSDLTDWQNNSGTPIARMSSGGQMNLPTVPGGSSTTLGLGSAMNSPSASGTFIGINSTSFSGDLMDLQVGGTKEFTVGAAGNINAAGTITGADFVGSGAGLFGINAASVTNYTASSTGTTITGGTGSIVVGNSTFSVAGLNTGPVTTSGLNDSGAATITGAASITGGLVATASTISGTTLSGAGNINTAGTITGSDFVGSGAGLSGIVTDWPNPGTIGSGTPNSGVFTALTASTMTLNGTLTLNTMSGDQGSILFLGSSGAVSQNNSQLFWNNTNNSLKIGPGSAVTNAAFMVSGGNIDIGPPPTGVNAGNVTQGSGLVLTTAGTRNIFLGTGNAGFPNTSTSDNVALGNSALIAASGSENVALGSLAGSAIAGGFGNTAVGYKSLLSNTSANSNTGIGFEALQFNTNGSPNTAMGAQALNANQTGNDNVAVGFQALSVGTGVFENVAVGDYSANNTSGTGNTAVGFQALQTNTTGNYNTAVGMGAGPISANLSYTIAIGSGSQPNSSNSVVIGSAGTINTTILYGDVGIDQPSPVAPLDVNGHISDSAAAAPIVSGSCSLVSGNDTRGRVTLSGLAGTTCQIAFSGTGFSSQPYCTVSAFLPTSGIYPVVVISSLNGAALQIESNTSGVTNPIQVSYICLQ